MTRERLTVSADVDPTTARTIEGGLDAFNEGHVGPDPTKPVWIVRRDGDGIVLGGLKGYVQWDWFVIAILWVRDGHRGRGIGRELLSEAEGAARKLGCERVRLTTLTFQAPEFYRKRGFEEMFRLTDVPPGHAAIWMSKSLAA